MPKKITKNKTPKIDLLTEQSFNLSNALAIIGVILVFILASWGITNLKKAEPKSDVAAAQTVVYDCNEGQDVLSVLKEKNQTKTEDSEFGVYVDQINNTSNNDGGFWIYYVNGEMGTVGADKYVCKAGDKVEWRYEQLYQ